MGKMRKEVVAGLAIIALMLVIFGSLLYKRLRPAAADGDNEPTISAREMAVPIREPEPKRTVIAAETLPDGEVVQVEARDWSGRRGREVEPVAVDPVDAPPRESYLPRDEAALADAGADSYGGDPFAQRRQAVEDDAALPGEGRVPGDAALQQQVDQELHTQADRDTLEAAVDSAERRESLGRREPAGARYEEDAPAEAIPTSGTYGAEAEMPRSGLRSRFPQSEAGGGGYDAYDRQPGHLRHEGGAGHMHAQVTVENGKYTVQPNDNYWIVSQKVYGDGGYFKAIYEHNRLRYPRADKLQVGDVLDVPPAAVLLERYADMCPKPRKAPPRKTRCSRPAPGIAPASGSMSWAKGTRCSTSPSSSWAKPPAGRKSTSSTATCWATSSTICAPAPSWCCRAAAAKGTR